ncbi:MAG TPA: DegV family protein [Anaerolineales bacterium]|nr:DegV family protein [Anaerolineales bacterium]HLE73969.1 DegV family protein [Anaerolineales bacterium]
MASVCIASDSTTLFPNPVFPGRSRVHLLPESWQNGTPPAAERVKAADFPQSLQGSQVPLLATPGAAEFEKFFKQLGAHYGGVLAILPAARFSKAGLAAQTAAAALHGSVPVRVVDSATISLGLGFIVQAAAEAAEGGMALGDLDLFARGLVPKIYGLLCIPGLSYLQRGGHVNPSQAAVGEYLHITQVYTLEEGELVPTQKARNPRHLVDILVEFLSEFIDLQHVALMQGAPAFEQETRALRERLHEERREVPISEQTINGPFASFIGPHSLGVFALER